MHRCCCCCCSDDLGKKHSSGAGRARAGDIRRCVGGAARAKARLALFSMFCVLIGARVLHANPVKNDLLELYR